MPGLEWNTINRLADMDMAGGLVSHMSGLGALGKGEGAMWPALNAAARKKAAELSRTLPMKVAQLDQQLQQVQQAYQQVQDMAAQAADLASQSSSTAPLSMVDRFNAILTSLDENMAAAQSAYDKVPSLPQQVNDASNWSDGWNTAMHNLVHTEWPNAERGVTAAATALRAAAQATPRLVATAQGILRQVQQVVQREQQAAQAAAAREAQKLALEQQRDQQAIAIEQAKLQQQLAIEQARAQAELQRELALMQPPALPQMPTIPGASPYGLPPAPPGYTYYDPTTGQYVGSQQTGVTQPGGPFYAPSGVSYAEQSFFTPPQSQGFQIPPAQPRGGFSLPQGWTSLEYDALIEGESQYLRGIGDLGADGGTSTASSPLAQKIKAALSSVPAYSTPPGSGPAKPQAYGSGATSIGQIGPKAVASKGDGGGFGIDDLTTIIGAAGAAAGAALPFFGYGQQQAPPPPPPQSSIPWGKIALGGAAVVGALAVGSALSKGAAKGGRRRTYRRRSR
jgi:hypothetical protein